MKQYETFVKKEKLDEKLMKIQQFKKLNEKQLKKIQKE